MIRHPRRSTLFPTTPLSRSRAREDFAPAAAEGEAAYPRFESVPEVEPERLATSRTPPLPAQRSTGHAHAPEAARRSEEHTSELQSRQYLVCRLLLEKKKQNT